jgi:hypothetical protein
VGSPSLGPTRTEADFAAHAARTVAADPAAGYVFLVDRLTTHQAETLVRRAADFEGCRDDLGGKGESGVPHPMASRAACLSDPCRRLQFVDLPTHASWLTQTRLLADPDRDLGQHPGAAAAQARRRRFDGGAAKPDPGLRRLPQPPRQALPLDLHRPPPDGPTRSITSADVY